LIKAYMLYEIDKLNKRKVVIMINVILLPILLKDISIPS